MKGERLAKESVVERRLDEDMGLKAWVRSTKIYKLWKGQRRCE